MITARLSVAFPAHPVRTRNAQAFPLKTRGDDVRRLQR